MAKRFTAGFKDDLGLEYNIDFYDSDYSGSTVGTLTLATPGFEMDWDGRSQNTHEPILASACSIPIYVSTASEQTFVSNVQTGQEGRFRVEIFRGPSASQELFWSGVLFCDITLQDEDPQLVTLEATDDLGLLDEVLYKNSPTSEFTDTTHLILVFCRILGKVRHIDAWAADKNFLYVSDHVQHDDMTGAPYTRKIIINHTKLRNVNNNGEAEFFTCKEVLVAMLNNLQARLMQYHGAWWIIPVAKSNTGMTAYAYFKNGDNGNNTTANTPGFVTQTSGNLYALSTAVTSANKTKLAGFEFASLPSLSEVNYPHNYEGHAYDWNGIGAGNDSGNITSQFVFANSAPVLEDNDIVSLTFSYVVSFLGYGTNASADRGRRIRIAFKVRHGDIYARRNAGPLTNSDGVVVTNTYTTNGDNMDCFVVSNTAPLYNTTTSNEIQEFTAVYDRFAGAHLTGTVTITFPPIDVDLGTVAATEVGEWDIKIFDKDNNDVTSADTTLGFEPALQNLTSIYQTRGGSTFDGDTITFTRRNGASNARESLDLQPAMLADLIGNSNPNQGVWLVNNDGTFVKSTGNWSNSKYSSVSTPICDLTCLDILSMRQTPLSLANGTVRFPNNTYGPCFAVQGLDEDTDYYVPMRLRLNANEALYEGEWFKYQYDSSTATTASDDSVPIPGGVSNLTIGFRRDRMTLNTLQQAMSDANTRLTGEIQGASKQIAENSVSVSSVIADVVAIEQQTDASGGKSTVHLEYLGDVKISGVSDGQILQYSATAGRWGNTALTGGGSDNSLSETDQTISGGTTRKIILAGAGGGSLAVLQVEDAQGNILEAIQSFGFGIVIQEKYGALAVRSTSVMQGALVLYEATSNGLNFITIKAPAAVTANTTLVLPDGAGSSGQVLTTDGSGNLSWSTVSGGGGSSAPCYLLNTAGRFQWSSADDGERVMMGHSAGAFNQYTWFTEPTFTSLKQYSSTQAVGDTTSVSAFHHVQYAVQVPTSTKKIKVHYVLRIQSAPASSTWGFSIWGGDRPDNGNNNTTTVTLRHISPTITHISNSSSRIYSGSFTTADAFTDESLFFLAENRSGSLTGSVFMPAQLLFELVD